MNHRNRIKMNNLIIYTEPSIWIIKQIKKIESISTFWTKGLYIYLLVFGVTTFEIEIELDLDSFFPPYTCFFFKKNKVLEENHLAITRKLVLKTKPMHCTKPIPQLKIIVKPLANPQGHVWLTVLLLLL